MRFRVHTALHEESSNGWIWASLPELRGRHHDITRRIVKITNPDTRRSIHCEYRELDTFFLRRYNRDKPHDARGLTIDEAPIVINLWYRAALGISGINVDVDLDVRPEKVKWLGAIRAGSQHPDVITRLATGLGVIGVWLGVTSVVVSLMSFRPDSLLFRAVAIAIVILSALFGIWLSKGVNERGAALIGGR